MTSATQCFPDVVVTNLVIDDRQRPLEHAGSPRVLLDTEWVSYHGEHRYLRVAAVA
jgi:hypothetical protein